MVVSAAKLEANRRNAQKSTGPRTEEGKKRSSLNAVTLGLRAETLILLDEDPLALADRKEAWRASLLPRDDVERSAVDDAVEYAWLRDRARRAQAARLATNIANAGVDQAKREADEVLRLGHKLFSDNRGPLAAYPHVDIEKDFSNKRVSHSDLVDDPEDPQRLVLHLQATAAGCQWMLDQWSELRSILAEGLSWQSADKLKAVRLLGRHPIEAADDRNVLMIFLACQTMEGQPITVIPEIWKELRDHERKPYARRLAGRGIDRLAPEVQRPGARSCWTSSSVSRRRSNSRPPHIAAVPRSSTPWPRTAFSLMRAPKANACAVSSSPAVVVSGVRWTRCARFARPRKVRCQWSVVRCQSPMPRPKRSTSA